MKGYLKWLWKEVVPTLLLVGLFMAVCMSGVVYRIATFCADKVDKALIEAGADINRQVPPEEFAAGLLVVVVAALVFPFVCDGFKKKSTK